MLAADADLEVGPRPPAALDADLDQLTDALLVEHGEGVGRQEVLLQVLRQELRHVVPAIAVRHLCEVVGPEREELGRLRDLIGDQRRARHLDHRADQVLHRHTHLRDDPVGHLLRLLVGELHLAHGARQRDHDLGLDVHALGRHRARRLHDRAYLHAVDLGIRDPEPAAAVTQHRVRLLERADLRHRRLETLPSHVARV